MNQERKMERLCEVSGATHMGTETAVRDAGAKIPTKNRLHKLVITDGFLLEFIQKNNLRGAWVAQSGSHG